jgi:hypothetical protein
VLFANLTKFCHTNLATAVIIMIFENVRKANIRPQEYRVALRLFCDLARSQEVETLLEKLFAYFCKFRHTQLARVVRIVIGENICEADVWAEENWVALLPVWRRLA